MTGDSGCGAWPQPLLSCTTSLSIAMFVNVLFSAFRVGAPEQPRKVTDFFFSAKLFRKKKCWKSCEAGVGPGPLPGFLLKSECKVTNLRRNFQMFLQLFFEENQPQARNALQTHRLQPQKKLAKQKFHDRHNRPIPPHAQAGPSTDLNLLNIYAHAKNLLVKKKYRTFAYHKRRKTCY